MNALDFYMFIPIAIGFVIGLFKGLIKAVTSLAAIVIGIYGAKFLAPATALLLQKTLHISLTSSKPLAYIILFAIIAIGMLLLANVLDKLFDSLSLGGLNIFLGGVFGALKYALIISVLLNIFNAIDSRFPLVSNESKEHSMGYKPLMNLAPDLWNETHPNHETDNKK